MIRLEISMERHEEMISYNNDCIISEYFDKIQENFLYCLLFPLFLVYLVLYGVYLACYGILVAILWVQDDGLVDIMPTTDNRFLRILVGIIFILLFTILYILSAIFALPVYIVLMIFYGILFVITAIVSNLNNE